MTKYQPMVEMRYVVPEGTHVPPPIPRLQYRYITPSVDASGAFCPPGVWSDWIDVPVTTTPDKTSMEEK